MQCKVEQMALNLNEKRKLQRFLQGHERVCPGIRENCTYSLRFSRGSGIGVSTKVVCSTCQEKKDITDYGAW